MSENDKRVDPKLKELMEKILRLLQQYDVGGAISLQSEANGEFYVHLPSWSLCKYERLESGELAMRLKFKKDLGQLESLEKTAGMIIGMKDVSARFFMVFEHIEKELRSKCHIEHNSDWKLGGSDD